MKIILSEDEIKDAFYEHLKKRKDLDVSKYKDIYYLIIGAYQGSSDIRVEVTLT